MNRIAMRRDAESATNRYVLVHTEQDLKDFAQKSSNDDMAALALIKRGEAIRAELHYRVERDQPGRAGQADRQGAGELPAGPGPQALAARLWRPRHSTDWACARKSSATSTRPRRSIARSPRSPSTRARSPRRRRTIVSRSWTTTRPPWPSSRRRRSRQVAPTTQVQPRRSRSSRATRTPRRSIRSRATPPDAQPTAPAQAAPAPASPPAPAEDEQARPADEAISTCRASWIAGRHRGSRSADRHRTVDHHKVRIDRLPWMNCRNSEVRPLTLHVGVGITERRLDKYLHGRFRNLSRHFLQDAIRSGGVKVNGKPAKPSLQLTPRRRHRDGDPGAAEQEHRAGEYPAGRPLRGRRHHHPEQAART